MSITPLNKTQSTQVPGFPGWRLWAREQYGYAASGSDVGPPLRYELQEGTITSFRRFISDGSLDPGPDPCSVSVHTMKPFSDGWQSMLNEAYYRFKEQAIGEESQLGTSFAEWDDSLGMIASRARKMRNAYSLLRRGDFRRFLKSLQLRAKKRHRGKERAAEQEVADLWLEYHFGWSPLLGDIHSAAQVLSEPLPSGSPVFGSVKRSGGDVSGIQEAYWDAVCRVGGGVNITNPNLALASRLGLINPAAVAWELIPFSFLADWCFDISGFLGSFSDFAGMEVINGYTTCKVNYDWKIKPAPGLYGEYKAKQVFMRRALGIPQPFPNWDVQANLGQTLSRATTSVALLVQILSGSTPTVKQRD